MTDRRSPAQPLEAELSIGELARRTGLQPAQLRMWEARHGFPVPRRLDSGHRRYRASDAAIIHAVLRRRATGVRLEVAIAEAAASRPPQSPSVFAELRSRHPGLAVHTLRKTTLIAMSHAIEDECFAAADRPLLFGAFQHADFYAPSAGRWSELNRAARATVVFADDWPDTEAAGGPERITLAPDAPMRREWAVVCDAHDSTACLSAWELPGQGDVPDRHREFEAVWTVDPTAVRDAAAVAAHTAAGTGNARAAQLVEELAAKPTARETSPEAVTRLFNRVVSYVDRLTAP
ncbi:MerR family transcriptional regulator [Nocardioides panacisoli]|uniref:DICT sensory domain-containing protein n=1 Tax=Nocardioides panacisoli TaxID=627624 RepID=UPI001C62BB8F|nr:DICT sensory domain-containing protein [Nocardioides panacisoli]QYJ03718.1 MerR family transcriptional regulator [Nocardioides panacisoli]